MAASKSNVSRPSRPRSRARRPRHIDRPRRSPAAARQAHDDAIGELEAERLELADRMARIQLLVLDVDGVLTDGRIYVDADGRELKVFNVYDGAGIKYWQRAGRQVAIISGRQAAATLARAAELGIALLRQNAKQKLPVYMELLAQLGLEPAQVAVMGDDLPDLPLLRHCGLAIAPANAVAEVKQASHLVTRAAGGEGAVREVIEALLRQAGLWEAIMQRYRQETS